MVGIAIVVILDVVVNVRSQASLWHRCANDGRAQSRDHYIFDVFSVVVANQGY